MIDVHCHLEQKEFNENLDEIISECKQKMTKIITSSVHPDDFEKTLKIIDKYNGFVYATAGLHPIYIKEFTKNKWKAFTKKIKNNKNHLIGIGEIGLDYHHIRGHEQRTRQKKMFIDYIQFANDMNIPIITHTRKAVKDCIQILQEHTKVKTLLHLFGDHNYADTIIENNWYVSFGPLIVQSRKHQKLAKKLPNNLILTETDSPWFGNGKIGTPLNVEKAIQKLSDIKKLSFREIDNITERNANNFFNL